MAGYLLDTNVVSELRRARPHGAVIAWLAGVEADDLFLSAVTVGEVQAGIEITRRQDPTRAAELEAWLDGLLGSHRILDMDARAFRLWGRLMHGRSSDLGEDAMIAATAMVHGLVVVTRNVRDFAPLGVPVLDPFAAR